MKSRTPILDGIRKLAADATSGVIPENSGYTSGHNKVLVPPPQQNIKKTPVTSLENAYKARGQSTSTSKPKGPQATTGLNTPNVADYQPSIMGFKM